MYNYYEDGYHQKITMRKAYRMFCVLVDQEQKEQGTTFCSWLAEMVKMQIFIEWSKDDDSKKRV